MDEATKILIEIQKDVQYIKKTLEEKTKEIMVLEKDMIEVKGFLSMMSGALNLVKIIGLTGAVVTVLFKIFLTLNINK